MYCKPAASTPQTSPDACLAATSSLQDGIDKQFQFLPQLKVVDAMSFVAPIPAIYVYISTIEAVSVLQLPKSE